MTTPVDMFIHRLIELTTHERAWSDDVQAALPLLDMMKSGECRANDGAVLEPEEFRKALQGAIRGRVSSVRFITASDPLRHPDLGPHDPRTNASARNLSTMLKDAWEERLTNAFKMTVLATTEREDAFDVVRNEFDQRIAAAVRMLTGAREDTSRIGLAPNAEAAIGIHQLLLAYAIALRANDRVAVEGLAPLMPWMTVAIPIAGCMHETGDESWTAVLLPPASPA